MPTFSSIVVATIAILAVPSVGAGPAVADATESFVSHRAFYEMQLGRTSSSSKIIGAEGRMAFEWREQCDGWVVQQQYLLEFSDTDGNVRDLNSRYSNYESKDGTRYAFLVRKSGLATVEEEIKGSASREPSSDRDGVVVAQFERPEAVSYDLGEGTLFPSAHTFALIDVAASGGRFFGSRIFDGSEVEPESVVTAAIGQERVGTDADFEAANGRYWPIRLAFFDSVSDDPEPTYEMDVDLLDNGVARELTLDYGEYEIDVSLVDLEVFEAPSC